MENWTKEDERIIDEVVNEAMGYTDRILDRLNGTAEEEEVRLCAIDELQDWLVERGLNPGELNCNLENEEGWCIEALDLGWPEGITSTGAASNPVAVQFYHTTPELLALAKERGFMVFESIEEFKAFVEKNC